MWPMSTPVNAPENDGPSLCGAGDHSYPRLGGGSYLSGLNRVRPFHSTTQSVCVPASNMVRSKVLANGCRTCPKVEVPNVGGKP
jgi:hypothetical protein